jgi:hypothetical protein
VLIFAKNKWFWKPLQLYLSKRGSVFGVQGTKFFSVYTDQNPIKPNMILQLVNVSTNKRLKVKISAMKAYRRNGGIAPLILNLGSRWRSVVSFTAWPLYCLEKEPLLSIW